MQVLVPRAQCAASMQTLEVLTGIIITKSSFFFFFMADLGNQSCCALQLSLRILFKSGFQAVTTKWLILSLDSAPIVIPGLDSYLYLCEYKTSYCGNSGIGWAKQGGVGARRSFRGKKVCWNEKGEMESVL